MLNTVRQISLNVILRDKKLIMVCLLLAGLEYFQNICTEYIVNLPSESVSPDSTISDSVGNELSFLRDS